MYIARCAELAGAEPEPTPPGELTIADEVKVSAWMDAAELIRRVWEQETDLDGFHELEKGSDKAWMPQAPAVIACDLLAELTEATARLSQFGKKSTPRDPRRATPPHQVDADAPRRPARRRAIAPDDKSWPRGARGPPRRGHSIVRRERPRGKDHEGIIGKIVIAAVVPAIIAGAAATGPAVASRYYSAGAHPSAAYGVATTVYSGPDHTDTGTDFPLTTIPQPGTATIHFNILGPGD